jgi:hypothetical protein
MRKQIRKNYIGWKYKVKKYIPLIKALFSHSYVTFIYTTCFFSLEVLFFKIKTYYNFKSKFQ